MAHAQNETSRGVSAADTPTLDLNHCRSVSTRLISANGVWQIWAARWVRSSKAVSGSVSRISYPLRTEILVVSLAGAVAIIDPPYTVDHFLSKNNTVLPDLAPFKQGSPPVWCQLFLPVVGKVVLDRPGFAAVGGHLAELAHFLGTLVEELQVTLDLGAVGLRRLFGVEVHYTLFQVAVKVHHAADVVDPKLFPAFEVGVIGVVTLAGIGGIEGTPVLPNDAVTDRTLNVADTCRHSILRCDRVPVSHPKIKLPILRRRFAGLLIVPGLLQQRSKLSVAVNRLQIGTSGHLLRLGIPLFHCLGQMFQGVILLSHGSVDFRQTVFNVLRWGTQRPCFLEGCEGLVVSPHPVETDAKPVPIPPIVGVALSESFIERSGLGPILSLVGSIGGGGIPQRIRRLRAGQRWER